MWNSFNMISSLVGECRLCEWSWEISKCWNAKKKYSSWSWSLLRAYDWYWNWKPQRKRVNSKLKSHAKSQVETWVEFFFTKFNKILDLTEIHIDVELLTSTTYPDITCVLLGTRHHSQWQTNCSPTTNLSFCVFDIKANSSVTTTAWMWLHVNNVFIHFCVTFPTNSTQHLSIRMFVQTCEEIWSVLACCVVLKAKHLWTHSD